MEIRILDREAAQDIDPAAWDRLADASSNPNPFFERWHLLPALRHLDRDLTIKVVTLYEDARLVGLFPLCLLRKYGLVSYLMIWEFRDCRVCDVLREPTVELSPVVNRLMSHFGVSIFLCPAHSCTGFDSVPDGFMHQIKLSRRAVLRGSTWKDYEAGLPRKYRLENRRVLTRLMVRDGFKHVSSESDLAQHWLPLYCEVERHSWKARRGRIIADDSGRLRYFEEALGLGEEGRKVQFQALQRGGETIAVAFRFRTRGRAYEVKTTYDERFRKLYPGVALELLTMQDVLRSGYELVDSCSESNRVVDRVWPDSIDFYRTLIFKCSPIGHAAALFYKAVRRLGERETH